jgi:acetyl esterase/lipase
MRRRWSVLVVVAFALFSAGCISLDPPPGAPPLRYRDEIFANVTKTSDVPYGLAPNYLGQVIALRLDVYRPTGDSVTNRPAIVWVHGGGFSGGTKGSGEIVDQAQTFARKGYVSVSISYRLRPTGCLNNPPPGSCFGAMLDAQHDAQAAVRFLRKNRATYGVDPNRIGIGGSSAGAVTAMNVGFNPNDPGESGNPGFSSAVRGASSLSGGRTIGQADPGDAPSLLFHGTADGIVPYGLAKGTFDQARAAGLASFLVTWQGAGHVPYGQFRNQIIDLQTNFFYGALDLANAAR